MGQQGGGHPSRPANAVRERRQTNPHVRRLQEDAGRTRDGMIASSAYLHFLHDRASPGTRGSLREEGRESQHDRLVLLASLYISLGQRFAEGVRVVVYVESVSDSLNLPHCVTFYHLESMAV